MAKRKKAATKKKATKKVAKKKVTKKAAAKKTATKKTAKKKATKKVAKKVTKKKATKKAAKKTATKKAAKKTATKKAAKKTKTKRKPNAAFMKPLDPSAELAAVVGAKPIPRTQVVKKLWSYIKKNDLQDPTNRRNINADDKLRKIFGKDQVSMFEMTKIVSKHLK
jgi:chromatin remodeling complex protein RSC6